MLKHTEQNNDNGLLGSSFWTIVKKGAFCRVFEVKKVFHISRHYVPAKIFPPEFKPQNYSRQLFFDNVTSKYLLKTFPTNSFLPNGPAKLLTPNALFEYGGVLESTYSLVSML